MKRIKLVSGVLYLLGITAITVGCNDFEVKSAPGFATDATSKAAATLIIQKCTGCHANGKSENGFGYVDKPELMIKNGYVTPGDHAKSLIYKKMSSTPPYGDRMPKGGPYLNESELQTIASWIDNLEDANAKKYTVTISGTTGISINPTGAVSVSYNKTTSMTVSASAGTIDQTVGGTCAIGSWAGSVYTTGKVTSDCSVSFTFDNEATVSGTSDVSGAVTLAVAEATIEKGQTYTFLAVAARTGDTLIKTLSGISGTCPKGAWAGSNYTTGVISGSCTVIFSTENPCPTVISGALSFASDVKPIFDTANCINAGCHNTGNGERAEFEIGGTFALSKIRNILGEINSDRKLVEPNKPLESVVYLNISATKNINGLMPLRGTPLTQTEESKVCNWILNGAN